jgi:hypothetical protein
LLTYLPSLIIHIHSTVNVGLIAGVGGSAAAMVLSPALMVFISGGVCIANCPYAFYKERELTKIPALRSMNNKLREDANRLEENVDELSSEIDILEPEADRAAKIEGQLREIADQQQVNVDKLVELVKENEIVLVEMRVSSVKSFKRVLFHPGHHHPANLLQLFICQDNLRKRIVQDIISIVVKSDKDNDQKIDKQEAKELALKIRLQLQEYDVDFDSQKFIKVIAKDPSVPGVIAIVQKLLPAEEKKKEVKVDSSSRNNADYMTDSDEDSEDEEEAEMYGKTVRPFAIALCISKLLSGLY